MKSLVQIDHEITNFIRTRGHSTFGFWKFMAAQGIYAFVIAALVFTILGQHELIYFTLAFSTAYLAAIFLQKLIKRNRPNFEELTGYKMWVHTYSYPSAHGAVSACAATALALFTEFELVEVATITIVGAAIWALLIGISRVVVGVHYFADVFFGWLLGFVIALGYVLVLVY